MVSNINPTTCGKRYIDVNKVHIELSDYLLELQCKNKLTEAEMCLVLSEELSKYTRYVNTEEHKKE